MTAALYILVYAAGLAFLIACLVRAVRYAKLPMHLRWELYPVPHEEPEKVAHGGSYFENGDWWTKPSRRNLAGEMKFMIPEMVFLKGLWEFNRKLWFRSFPFHFGLYLVGAAVLLLAGGAVLDAEPLNRAGVLLAAAGSILALAGAAGLLHRRLTDTSLKNYNAPADVFNLAFFILVFALLLAGQFTGAAPASAFMRGLLSFDTSLEIPPMAVAGYGLAALLLAYIPLTHMSHFIAKYFTYHSIRWDDSPNRGEGELARKIARYLSYRPTWSAPHIAGDGSKTWAEIATTNPAAGVKK